MYDFESKKVKRFLNQQGADRPAVQLPEGLRGYLDEITPVFEEVGVEPLILADSCYGACDIADVEADRLGCDVLVHYGHADMGFRTKIPTLYVEARMDDNPIQVLKEALPDLEGQTWGLTTTVQHIGWIGRVRKFLEENGVVSVIGDPGARVKYPGQVLGCDFSCARSVADEADGFLYIGTGRFHPLGIALAAKKDVIVINPIAGGHELLSNEDEDFLNQRKTILSKAAASERFGVLASTKAGQLRLGLAEELTGLLRENGYGANLFLMNELDQERLRDFKVGAFVCTACPRIPTDDSELYDRPILTPFEARVLLGLEDFRPYKLDEFTKKWA